MREFQVITFINGSTKKVLGSASTEDCMWTANSYPSVKYVQGFVKRGNSTEETCKVYPQSR